MNFSVFGLHIETPAVRPKTNVIVIDREAERERRKEQDIVDKSFHEFFAEQARIANLVRLRFPATLLPSNVYVVRFLIDRSKTAPGVAVIYDKEFLIQEQYGEYCIVIDGEVVYNGTWIASLVESGVCDNIRRRELILCGSGDQPEFPEY